MGGGQLWQRGTESELSLPRAQPCARAGGGQPPAQYAAKHLPGTAPQRARGLSRSPGAGATLLPSPQHAGDATQQDGRRLRTRAVTFPPPERSGGETG